MEAAAAPRTRRASSRALAINPDNADAHFNLAMLLGPQNWLDEAVAHLQRALEINPQNGEAHRNLAVAFGLQGKSTSRFGTRGWRCSSSRSRPRRARISNGCWPREERANSLQPLARLPS